MFERLHSCLDLLGRMRFGESQNKASHGIDSSLKMNAQECIRSQMLINYYDEPLCFIQTDEP